MEPRNDLILIPEFAIEKLLSIGLNFIRTDYKKQVEEYGDEKLSFLYYLTHGVGIQRLDVFKQAKKIFLIDDPKDPKRININLGFPQEIKGAINISIIHTGEQYSQNALGVDEDSDIFEEYVYNANEPEENKEISNAYRKTYGRRYSSSYNLVITGDNTNEVLIVYTILKSLFIAFEATTHLSVIGFQNTQITGNDLSLKSDIFKHMAVKNLIFKFEYEFRIPDIERLNYINGVIFNQLLLDK